MQTQPLIRLYDINFIDVRVRTLYVQLYVCMYVCVYIPDGSFAETSIRLLLPEDMEVTARTELR